MKSDTAPKFWKKTRVNNLVRHANGRYYARLFLNGKEIWKSLKTSHFSVAEARLATAVKDHRERKSREVDPANAKMTFEDASTLHIRRVDENVSLKRRTRNYWREVLKALLKSWPALATTEIRRITVAGCREWAARYAKKSSATRFNAAISLLRHVINIAIESGIICSNPASSIVRKPVRAKKLELPTCAQFAAFIAEMRKGGGRDSQNCVSRLLATRHYAVGDDCIVFAKRRKSSHFQTMNTSAGQFRLDKGAAECYLFEDLDPDFYKGTADQIRARMHRKYQAEEIMATLRRVLSSLAK